MGVDLWVATIRSDKSMFFCLIFYIFLRRGRHLGVFFFNISFLISSSFGDFFCVGVDLWGAAIRSDQCGIFLTLTLICGRPTSRVLSLGVVEMSLSRRWWRWVGAIKQEIEPKK